MYLIQFWSKFHKTSWLYCLLKVSPYPLAFFMYMYAFFLGVFFSFFFFDALSSEKGVSYKIHFFTNISFNSYQNFMKLHGYIVY